MDVNICALSTAVGTTISRCLALSMALGVCLIVLSGGATAAQATTLSGVVKNGTDTPIAGAMVTLRNNAGLAESVFTNQSGAYHLSTRLSGDLEMRFRKRYYQDVVKRVAMKKDQASTVDVELSALTEAKAISDDHPPLSHFSRIAFDRDESGPFSRENFARDCLFCHQLGNDFTRSDRTPEGWGPTVERMHGYLGGVDKEQILRRAEILSVAFADDQLATSRADAPYDPLLETAKIYQWSLPNAIVPHDPEVHSNGRIYISEMFGGEIIEVDLETNKIVHRALPADGMPPGGAFTKANQPAPFGLTVPRAPHSLAEGKDGKWYMTDSIGAAITSFDPKDNSFKSHDIEGVVYPHTIRIAKDGRAWFTLMISTQVGVFDPKTGETEVVNLPNTPTFGIPKFPISYGLDISPVDGTIWYTKVASDKIGRIDPNTLEVKEFDSPVKGPRRHRFDAAGKLWITGYVSGDIARLDTKTMESKLYPLPQFAPGEIPVPYALAVNPDTQDVWVADTMLNVAWRFIPTEERFVAYPLPLKGSYTREFTFTTSGWACTANNPIPPAALEGGSPELICIDPNYAPESKG